MGLSINISKKEYADNFLVSKETALFKRDQIIYKPNQNIKNIYIVLSGDIYSTHNNTTSEKSILLKNTRKKFLKSKRYPKTHFENN